MTPDAALGSLPPAIWALPAIAAAIGWGTNRVAIRLLFRPRRPVRLGPLVLWGLLPKRRQELAHHLGQVVERELLSPADIGAQLMAPAVRERLTNALRDHVRRGG